MRYDYTCPLCNEAITKVFPIGKPKNVKCSCGAQMQRVIPKLKFMLYGDGWAGKNRV